MNCCLCLAALAIVQSWDQELYQDTCVNLRLPHWFINQPDCLLVPADSEGAAGRNWAHDTKRVALPSMLTQCVMLYKAMLLYQSMPMIPLSVYLSPFSNIRLIKIGKIVNPDCQFLKYKQIWCSFRIRSYKSITSTSNTKMCSCFLV